MTSVGTALRRTLLLIMLAIGISVVLSRRHRRSAPSTPIDAPQWPAWPTQPQTAEHPPGPSRSAVDQQSWVPPSADGSVPASHPVKVKKSSGIFHVPGGRFYDRTRPDRCYPTAAAAEADGYRQSKT
jgi:hypothetical protein